MTNGVLACLSHPLSVASAILGNQEIIGCDIDAEAIKIARHLVATES